MYPIVGNEYVIANDFKIDVDVYDCMRSRLMKHKSLFIRDTCSILWTLQERARRCLSLQKCSKEIPGLKVATSRKVAPTVRKLIHIDYYSKLFLEHCSILTLCIVSTVLYNNWLNEDKGMRLSEKRKDLNERDVRKCLSRAFRDAKNRVFPNLVRHADEHNGLNAAEDND